MSKTRLFALLGVFIMLAAILTNPSKEKINDELRNRAKEILEKQLKYEHKDAVEFGMMLFGDRVVEEFVNTYVQTKNYYLFSLCEVNWNGEKVTVGGGAFSKVWISPKLDEKANELIKALKTQ